MFKKYKLLTLSVLATLVAILLGAISWVVQFVGIGLMFYIFSLIIIKEERNFKKLIILCLPFFIIYGLGLFLNSMHIEEVMHVIPILLVPFLSAFLALIIKAKYALITSILLVFFGFIFMENWLNYVFHNSDFKEKYFPTDKAYLKDINGDQFNFDSDKVYVVDLWNSSCRVCIEKFPEFEKLSTEYKSDHLELISLNIPLKRDDQYDIKAYVKDYNFKSVFSENYDLGRLIDVTRYPTFLIIDDSGLIVYAGSINSEWYHLYNNFDHLIKTHLKK